MKKNKTNNIHRFSSEKASIGDSFIYAAGYEKREDIHSYLKSVVPFNDMWSKLESDMKAHKCDAKHFSIDNDQSTLEVGFACDGCGTKWRIPLADVKASIVHFPEYREKIRTEKSRIKWANNL